MRFCTVAKKIRVKFIRGFVVVDGSSIEIGDLLVELALAQPDFPYLLKQMIEILVGNRRPVLEPLVIHHPAFDRVLRDDLVSPLPEGYGLLVVYLEAQCDYYSQIIVVDAVILAIIGSY